MSIETRLLKLKKKIEDAKTSKNRAEGALKEDMKRLKKDFKISTAKDAKKKIEKWQEQIEELEGELETELKKLEDKLEDE